MTNDIKQCALKGCASPAEFEIHSGIPYDETLACEGHVGALLGVPIGSPMVEHWAVWTLPVAGLPDKETP